MASLINPPYTTKNHRIKDYDRVRGQNFYVNTGIRNTGETDTETANLLKKAEAHLESYNKKVNRRNETARLLRKQAQSKMSVTLGVAIKGYKAVKAKSAKINKQTMIDYDKHLSYLTDCFGLDHKLGQITFGNLESLRDKLAETRTASGTDGIFRGIKAFLNWSYVEYELKNLDKIMKQFGKLGNGFFLAVGNKKPKKRIITNDEFNLVLGFVNDGTEFGHLCKTYFEFARKTGRRLTEICKGYIDGQDWHYGAKGQDEQAYCLTKDLVQSWLTIQSYLPKDKDGLIGKKELKGFTNKISRAFTTNMRKTILHSDPNFLKEYGLTRKDLYEIGRTKVDKMAKVLLIRRYAKMYNMTIKEMTAGDKRTAIKRSPSFHSLRHTLVTEMVNKKGIHYTKTLIGHSSTKTTEEYTHSDQIEVSKDWYGIN